MTYYILKDKVKMLKKGVKMSQMHKRENTFVSDENIK